MALKLKDVPQELIKSYLDKKCGFFVGAGLSQSVGYPGWHELLLGLIEKVKNNPYCSSDHITDYQKLAEDPNRYLMLAEEMREVLGGVELQTYIEDTFLRDDVDPSSTHDLLVSLKHSNFIITTNYDQLIEKAFVKKGKLQTSYKYYEAHAIQRELYKREFFLLKAHGDAKTAAEKIVLTDKDYRRLLYREPGYQSTLQSIFTMYSVIFVGCSLQDPGLKLLLNYINAAFPQGGIPHYALMAAETTGITEQTRWKKDYNMQIIKISSDKNYKDIFAFFNILREEEKK